MPTKCAAPLFNRRVARKSMPHFSETAHEMASAAGLRLGNSDTRKRIEMEPIVSSTRPRSTTLLGATMLRCPLTTNPLSRTTAPRAVREMRRRWRTEAVLSTTNFEKNKYF